MFTDDTEAFAPLLPPFKLLEVDNVPMTFDTMQTELLEKVTVPVPTVTPELS